MELVNIRPKVPKPQPQPGPAIPEPSEVIERDGVIIERFEDVYVLSKPPVGALSSVRARGLVAFELFYALRDDEGRAREAVQRLYHEFFDDDAPGAEAEATKLCDKLVRDGWLRTELPHPEHEPLHSIYFTVTRRCDLACPYCYQGLANRWHTHMPVDKACMALDKIKAVNPGSKIIVTGGEPFSHPDIFEILEEIDRRDLTFLILTNGTHIDQEAAARLKKMRNFLHVQLSIDGMTEETHSQTRGVGHLEKVMRALQSIFAHDVPFVLAPTMHNGNLHELYDVAALAISNGGWCSPNNLREFPHEGLNFEKVQLSNVGCLEALTDCNRRLLEEFGLELMTDLAAQYKGPSVCSVNEPNANFICGMGHSLMDLDWNGTVYPCHLTKSDELILGNLFEDDFDDIFRRVKERKIRVESSDIEKCSGCKFVSTCGGGCRAGAFFAYGSVDREDGLCSLNYRSNLRRILLSVGGS